MKRNKKFKMENTELDITNLINKAHELGQLIAFSAAGAVPVEHIEDENGGYDLIIVARRKHVPDATIADMMKDLKMP